MASLQRVNLHDKDGMNRHSLALFLRMFERITAEGFWQTLQINIEMFMRYAAVLSQKAVTAYLLK